jgi:hypothetical protein
MRCFVRLLKRRTMLVAERLSERLSEQAVVRLPALFSRRLSRLWPGLCILRSPHGKPLAKS